jgi:hypothetical protein
VQGFHICSSRNTLVFEDALPDGLTKVSHIVVCLAKYVTKHCLVGSTLKSTVCLRVRYKALSVWVYITKHCLGGSTLQSTVWLGVRYKALSGWKYVTKHCLVGSTTQGTESSDSQTKSFIPGQWSPFDTGNFRIEPAATHPCHSRANVPPSKTTSLYQDGKPCQNLSYFRNENERRDISQDTRVLRREEEQSGPHLLIHYQVYRFHYQMYE